MGKIGRGMKIQIVIKMVELQTSILKCSWYDTNKVLVINKIRCKTDLTKFPYYLAYHIQKLQRDF